METIKELDEKVEYFQNQLTEELARIVKIQSVKDEARMDAPFGEHIAYCLHDILDLCMRLGFRVKNLDNYVGYAEFGDGSEMEGILVHLDVVPAGSGWTTEPFGAEIKNGYMYGRGTLDDKGPALAAVFAAKAVMDSGLPIKKKIRIIFGCDEENLWKCMDYYKNREPLPDCGFSPDAQFPVIHAERGVLFIDILGNCSISGIIKEIHGGSKANMVPERCKVTLEVLPDKQEKVKLWISRHNFSECWNGNFLIVESTGKNAHASTPEKGKNAISIMIAALDELDIISGDQKDFVRFYNDRIGFDLSGSNLFGEISDNESGPLVFNVGILDYENGAMRLAINIRYPVTVRGSDVISRITEAVKDSGYKTALVLDSAPLYLSVNDPLVTTLMDIYHSYRNDGSKPLLIGGGTFARSISNVVAFGPVFPEEEDLAHCADEKISLNNLVLSAKIYAQAIYALAQ